MRPTLLITLLLPLAFSPAAQAELHHETIDYQDGDTPLQGYLVWDDAYTGKRPGIMVVHEWWGLNDYARARADKLAEAGYVACAADMYGYRQVTDHP
jgi:dienelactone hydrolase